MSDKPYTDADVQALAEWRCCGPLGCIKGTDTGDAHGIGPCVAEPGIAASILDYLTANGWVKRADVLEDAGRILHEMSQDWIKHANQAR